MEKMEKMKVEFIRKGTKIIESCLDKCERLRLSIDIFKPNQEIMDMMLAKDYLKVHLIAKDQYGDILIFHNSEDEYAHNSDIRFTCFLSQVPKVLEHVRKHRKVLKEIEEIEQRERR